MLKKNPENNTSRLGKNANILFSFLNRWIKAFVGFTSHMYDMRHIRVDAKCTLLESEMLEAVSVDCSSYSKWVYSGSNLATYRMYTMRYLCA